MSEFTPHVAVPPWFYCWECNDDRAFQAWPDKQGQVHCPECASRIITQVFPEVVAMREP